jgi:hypothetical protein
MRSRAEVTTRYAKAYVSARKKDKGRVLDEVVSVTGWSRDNARRRLTAAAAQRPGSGRVVAVVPRKPRAQGYSYDARKVLQRVWAASGGQCGKYLAASMRAQLDALERHGELVPGQARYSMQVRAELLAMSAATIDRYLAPAKADALAAARPGRPGQSPEQAELAQAREEIARLRATVTEQAVALHLHEGKARWD